MLRYSRVTAQARHFHAVNVSEIIQDAVSVLELAIEKANARIEVGELPVIDADGVQILHLFQNLIDNSIKYCKISEPPVVKIYSTVNEGSCVIFIEDNGIGFEEHYLDQIFKPFQRLHGRSSTYEGTGMGLAICRKIVEKHGGTITARSAPGQGSTFIINFPVERCSP
jgi:signal transduction histidine kinase